MLVYVKLVLVLQSTVYWKFSHRFGPRSDWQTDRGPMHGHAHYLPALPFPIKHLKSSFLCQILLSCLFEIITFSEPVQLDSTAGATGLVSNQTCSLYCELMNLRDFHNLWYSAIAFFHHLRLRLCWSMGQIFRKYLVHLMHHTEVQWYVICSPNAWQFNREKQTHRNKKTKLSIFQCASHSKSDSSMTPSCNGSQKRLRFFFGLFHTRFSFRQDTTAYAVFWCRESMQKLWKF